jgi:hypothetical protein
MQWIEQRVQTCESRLEYLIRYLQDLRQQIVAAAQAARTASSSYGGGGGSSTSGTFYCYAPGSGGPWGSTGTLPSATPGSFTATVYQTSGTTQTSIGSFTVYNWFPASPATSKMCYVVPDGAGSFVLPTQSCT